VRFSSLFLQYTFYSENPLSSKPGYATEDDNNDSFHQGQEEKNALFPGVYDKEPGHYATHGAI
jgi:hypothetical protein